MCAREPDPALRCKKSTAFAAAADGTTVVIHQRDGISQGAEQSVGLWAQCAALDELSARSEMLRFAVRVGGGQAASTYGALDGVLNAVSLKA